MKVQTLSLKINIYHLQDLQNNSVEVYNNQSFVRVYNYSHGMYDTNNDVIVFGVEGDKKNGALTISGGTLSNMTDGSARTITHHQ